MPSGIAATPEATVLFCQSDIDTARVMQVLDARVGNGVVVPTGISAGVPVAMTVLAAIASLTDCVAATVGAGVAPAAVTVGLALPAALTVAVGSSIIAADVT